MTDRLRATVRALRGATTVERDTAADIVAASAELVREVCARNSVAPADVISIVFTATPDLTSEFPAAGARSLGLSGVPLLCAREIDVRGALRRCIRVLVHVHTDRAPEALEHVYLADARALREDLGR